jgi:16S rRNA (guanine527-N7)-methyltransferase
MSSAYLQVPLQDGVKQLSLDVSAIQQQQMLKYLELLQKWNKAYNLTAIREPLEMLSLHLFDSLSVASFIEGERFIDVGTGPGLPGIPLAILYPGRQFVLLDSNGKKTRFLFQAKNELGLKNVQEVQSRVETYQPKEKFDGILSRAFTSTEEMVSKCQHLLRDGGRFYAMKGQHPQQELSAIPKEYMVVASHPLQVPGVNAERHLIEIRSSQ